MRTASQKHFLFLLIGSAQFTRRLDGNVRFPGTSLISPSCNNKTAMAQAGSSLLDVVTDFLVENKTGQFQTWGHALYIIGTNKKQGLAPSSYWVTNPFVLSTFAH